jgi:dTDP-4-dehydrorhamnose reductase
MKSLIIGSGGLVGSALTRCLPDSLQGVLMEAKNKQQIYLDLAKYETMFKVFSRYRPQVIYLAGAVTDVNACEDYGTSLVNVKGTIECLRLCEQFEAKLVFYSTSYVFDGTKQSPYALDDETKPIQMYGKQKNTVENMILQSETDYLIIRTVGVFGQERKRKNFAQQVLRSVFFGKDVHAPIDQYMNPILSNDLARITIGLVNKNINGLFHVAGDTCLSKFEFARMIAKNFGYEDKIKPETTEEMKQRAKRPLMGCLDCSELLNYGFDIPSLNAGLQNFYKSGVLDA